MILKSIGQPDLKVMLSSAVAFLLLMSSSVQAADAENGRTLARSCSVCHGKLGLSNDPEAPGLAGQPALYLEKSLADYQSGARSDRRMTLIAEPLSKADIKDLAAWFASIEVTATDPDAQE